MPQYRVRAGKQHGSQKQYRSGDIVELTEQEAAGFLDKLERVEETLPVSEPDIVQEYREEIASEPSVFHFWQDNADQVTLTTGTTGTVMSADTPVTLTVPLDIPEPEPVRVEFSSVRGIGLEIQQALYDAGYATWEDILLAGAVKIKDDIASIGLARARRLFAQAQFEGGNGLDL